MLLLSRWHRRAAALWVGILAAWAAVLVVAYLRARESFVLVLGVSALIALAGGVLRTIRIRAEESEPLITVEDLRRR